MVLMESSQQIMFSGDVLDWGTDGIDRNRKVVKIMETNVLLGARRPALVTLLELGSASEPTVKDWLEGSDGAEEHQSWSPAILSH